MKKILITGVGDTRNNGCWAMVRVATKLIREYCPEPVKFYILTHKLSKDRDRLRDLNITFITQPWTLINIPKLRYLWSLLCFIFMPVLALILRITKIKIMFGTFWKHFLSCDMVLDLSGDSLSADYSNFSLAIMALPLAVARILDKPFMLCAQSIGPFYKHPIHKMLIILVKEASIITSRERITDEVLYKLGIINNVIPAQDLAFSLSPAPQERIQQICFDENIDPSDSWIGMSISGLISNYAFKDSCLRERRKAYLQIMAEFADYIVTRYDKKILFVSHVVKPNENSDFNITTAVKELMKNSDRAKVIGGSYLADELKGLIGLCEAFIGSRMHATIASMSLGIPTLTYAYNHKTLGINGQILNQNKYLIDIRNIDGITMLSKSKRIISELLENKIAIKNHLTQLMSDIMPLSIENAWLAVGLLENAGPLGVMKNPMHCNGCGACVLACKKNVLQMQSTHQGTLRPRLVGSCDNCGKCHHVCPALGFNLTAHESALLNNSARDPEIGVVISTFKGYAADPILRSRGSSGGLITAVTKHLIKEHWVDAVLVVGDSPEYPLSPMPYLAENVEDILKARGSKYAPVALLAALKNIPQNIKNIAVVGLPCHLWGLKLIEQTSVLKGLNIKFRLGLFCGKTPNQHALEFILHEMNVDKNSVTRIQYRGDGWPGGLKIETKNKRYFIPLKKFWHIMGSPYYQPTHCFMCPDFFAHLSDISFGDAWLEECRHNKEGWSICLARSNTGNKLLKILEAKRILCLNKISIGMIKQAMIGNIIQKYRQEYIKKYLFSPPVESSHNQEKSVTRLKERLDMVFRYKLSGVGQSRFLEQLLLSFPPNTFMKTINRCQRFLS